MIFKKRLLLIFLCALSFVYSTPVQRNKIAKIFGPTTSIKAGYFTFSGSKMRKIYDQGGIDVQLSGSYPFGTRVQLYGAIEYLEKQGRSLHGREATRIFLVPFSFGIQPMFEWGSNIHYYMTLGPRFFILCQKNFSAYVDKHVTEGGAGAFANTGLHLFFYEKFFFDLFAEYSYLRVKHLSYQEKVYSQSVQVGGYTFGLGLGFKF